MEKLLVMKIKDENIEVEVQGNCEDVKEQFAIALAAVKDIHQMKTETTNAATEDITNKVLNPLLAMLKD